MGRGIECLFGCKPLYEARLLSVCSMLLWPLDFTSKNTLYYIKK